MKTQTIDIHIAKTIRLSYLVHLPQQAQLNPAVRWPTILFLHGRDEAGNDPTVLLRQGLPKYIAHRPDFPFIMIAPQCPQDTEWPELADSLAQLLDACSSAYSVDRQRLYLTGLSMGGSGAWYLGAAWPQRFAAIAPICGGGFWFHGFPQRVCALKETPIWAFHGAQDAVIPISAAEELVNTLRECGGDVEFTVYPDVGHDSWTETYNNTELYRWFLRHVRR